MKFTKSQIVEHYKSEAEKHGMKGTSTIQDYRTRLLEIKALASYFTDGLKVLEIGGGNGFTSAQLISKFDIELVSTDFSHDMVKLAKQREIPEKKGTVSFEQLDVLELDSIEQYDLIFTERCLQNLPTWELQQQGLLNIAKALKPGGCFIMLESFMTGLNNLNEARAELDLDSIDSPWHNLFFNEEDTLSYMESIGCISSEQNMFLSGYYFGSRVLLPAVTPPKKVVSSKSILNDYFCELPAHGDFCPMKIIKFVKS